MFNESCIYYVPKTSRNLALVIHKCFINHRSSRGRPRFQQPSFIDILHHSQVFCICRPEIMQYLPINSHRFLPDSNANHVCNPFTHHTNVIHRSCFDPRIMQEMSTNYLKICAPQNLSDSCFPFHFLPLPYPTYLSFSQVIRHLAKKIDISTTHHPRLRHTARNSR